VVYFQILQFISKGENMDLIQSGRDFLKGDLWKQWDGLVADENKDIPQPPAQKELPTDAQIFKLIKPDEFTIDTGAFIDALKNRQSRRSYTAEALSLEELSFLLWAVQGVRPGLDRMRNVPSAGCCHPLETYLYIQRTDGLKPGLYRYLPVEHALLLLNPDDSLIDQFTAACLNQDMVRESAVLFIWTAVPYRMEWKYCISAARLVAMEAGHVCQNLYLAAEAAGLGTCSIGACLNGQMDTLLGVDGQDEFAVYLSAVGKV